MGPTASGKSAVAMQVAALLPAEIIAMDSRQVYRGLDVGTAKPSREERARVPHHGLDLVEPDGRYSAGRFARDARRWIAEIRHRGRTPLLVGGTGFFLRALTHPLFREPPLPPRAREPLRRYLGALSDDERARWLAALDPSSAASLAARGGAQRQARALEVALLSGRPLSWWHRRGPAAPPVPLLVCVLDVPPVVLGTRIEERLGAMMERGLPDEVAALADRYGADAPSLRAPGYAQLLPWLEGSIGLEEATREAVAATRRLARRQRTWFRHQLPAGAVRLDGTASAAASARAIADAWTAAVGTPAGDPQG